MFWNRTLSVVTFSEVAIMDESPKTMTAPISVPAARRFPNSQILKRRLTSLRIFKTMVTVSADETAAKRFTPRMQAYCVRTLVASPSQAEALDWQRERGTIGESAKLVGK
ncbi:hypothetical protein Cob_v005218 [Colletotrichum orbiculare MAFF 240422]|uniref:Uncharacterized protein n=1 Tax=Colletotrichum orbiculare (strain 104-T / ATCC 96160 / CBS 514.97 / LARS 414 / MAFF 240422) TaxID=1213857 RepID=A0A484FW83_COLOR|nr:hypothetical protein Cob_v005218 [Colletotrichum orbiculare MAFF 240422]